MSAYYNEIDPYAAAWLRNLIDAGHIARGVVDTRDVRDVRPFDLDGFTQCHFFAGVGIWSYALRLAGWGDDQPVWTASCPCQPFSAAGAGLGFADERHLWPHIHWLVEQCRPQTLLGEQVASKDGLAWFDTVSSDMEATDYAIGGVDTCAAGFGAPHIRQRLYFAAYDIRPATVGLADSASTGLEVRAGESRLSGRQQRPERLFPTDGMGDPIGTGPQGQRGHVDGASGREVTSRSRVDTGFFDGLADADERGRAAQASPRLSDEQHHVEPRDGIERMGDTKCNGRGQHGICLGEAQRESQGEPRERERLWPDPANAGANDRPTPTNGFWRNADWLFCRDGKWRPVRSGSFPLATRSASRVGRLRAYGNGLCAYQAAGFISAYMEQDMVTLEDEPAGDLFEWGA